MKNQYEIKGNNVVLFVNCKGEKIEVLISRSDLERVKEFPYTWYAHFNKRRNVYIVSGNFSREGKQRKRTLLSRWIMKPQECLVVDHINHNTLDNRRENLRILTIAENAQNLVEVNKHGKLRGVSKRNDKTDAWIAYLTKNGKRIYLGQFSSREEANKVAKDARKKHFPYSQENLME